MICIRAITVLLLICAIVGWIDGSTQTTTERALRVALIGFVDGSLANEQATAAPRLEDALESALKRDARVVLIERSQLQPALAGIGHNGSINMTRNEARGLGAAIGCDFFIVGKKDISTRSQAKGESHEEALVGVMIVDGRTGALAVFDFLNEKAATKEAALAAIMKAIEARAQSYVDRMNECRAAREALSQSNTAISERIEEVPDAESALGAGFKSPEFSNRVKPEYTETADRADISATVEAVAVFRANGEVGEIEITRWAGFGLDEAAENAIRKLKFKPATRDGQAISVRATVRYNFRRTNDQPRKPDEPAAKPQDPPVPDLRKYFKPGYRP
ncbi:MAG TPA: energy transducer TonB [Blastocatellia bacterium]|nr:energy transducer TonB [Blastocatellia bacterium]